MEESIRALHVDDDPSFVDVTAEVLERESDGIEMISASNAREARERLTDDIDCVVSDYEMPKQDGIEFLETVREQFPDLPFLLFTGKGSEEIASKAIDAGVTGYMQKSGGTEQFQLLANKIATAVEKYRSEKELDALRRQYRKLVEQNLVGIYIIQEGEFVYVNPRLAEIHGYDREEVVGMSPLEFVAPQDRDRVRENLDKRLQGEVDEVQYQITGLCRDGERIDIELHGSRIEYDGDPAVIGAELDITDRKERERELERKNEQLEKFTSIVSHDLQNPLQVATTNLELARQECDSDRLEAVGRAHERMRTLIDDLLTLARQGETVSGLESVDLAATLERCWANVETAGGDLVVDADLVLRADRTRLEQLLENLLSNAIEHGGEDVTIRVGTHDDGFYVADDGTGIPDEDREEVFESGYSSRTDGTGFGLPIVEQIAEAHGWTVTATESDEGGARFEISGVY
jgi:PAS domain S-box-containing protein